jgi:cytoskeletal protein RodZ
MNGFKNKEIISEENLGDKLRNAREKKKISLKQVEHLTKIRAKYLEDLENSHYDDLPGEVYVRNFIKVYAGVLDLEFEPLFELYKKERSFFDNLKEKRKNFKAPRVIITPRSIKIGLLSLVIVALLVYLGSGVKRIISAPDLIIDNPADKLVTSQESIKVQGRTEREVKVTINNQEILSNKDGYFEKIVDLQKGINIIKITAVKKRSKESIVYREVLVE